MRYARSRVGIRTGIKQRLGQLFVAGSSSQDVIQGSLGDCWFLGALACLATKQEMLEVLMPWMADFDVSHAIAASILEGRLFQRIWPLRLCLL
jgi:hypothetical protein